MKKLPEDFIKRISEQRPNDHSVFLDAIQRDVISSIQLNESKETSLFQEADHVPWWPKGRFLNERPKFTQDPLFHAGAYYSQESSSMFVGWVAEQVLAGKEQVRVLDLCAAPGGKSLLLSSIIGERGCLISNEINKTRNAILVENLVKWGATNVIVTQGDAASFAKCEDYFDLILVDAPCSGEGMFRKDDVAIAEWSLANVEMCARRQEDILKDVLPLLRDDGHLIYSTCTFSVQENEAQSEWVVSHEGMEGVSFDVPGDWQIEEVRGEGYVGYKFLPHKVKGEGFYCSVFKRADGLVSRGKYKGYPKIWYRKANKTELAEAKKWLELEREIIVSKYDTLHAINMSWEEYSETVGKLFVTMAGVEIGKMLREDLVPSHSLALQPNVHSGVQRLLVDRGQALDYLCKEEMKIETPITGWALVVYENISLGWVKVLKQRINNYYPKEWKIRYRES
ncbi:MAG: methyltransferase RsmF C-terminal domain-like protein [Flavobacteriales bacterium]